MVVSGLYNVLVAAGVLDALTGYELYMDEYRWRRLFHEILFSSVLVGWVLVPAGLSALTNLVEGRVWRGLAKWGSILAGASAAVFLCMVAYRYFDPMSAVPGDAYLAYGMLAGWLVGLLVLGVAALRVRGLGCWRAVPILLAAAGSPLAPLLAQSLISFLLPPPEYLPGGSPTVAALLFWGPQMLSGIGWMAFARPLALAPARGRALVAQENLALARRLYAEAWTRGDLSVVDDVSAPDLEDGYGGGRGPRSLKRSIVRLRNAFPDLRFVVEAQTAQGDEVTTRWSAGGTDLGGVLWYPPTGKAATFSGVYTDRFEGGKLVEHRGESDTAGLLEQLGLPKKGSGPATLQQPANKP